MKGRARGYTFLEMMFVVVIIGLLSTIVIGKLSNAGNDARRRTTQAQISTLAVAVERFQLDTGVYPTTDEGLNALIRRPTTVSEHSWNGPYLSSYKLPQDAWGRDFRYKEPGEMAPDYDIWSLGRDGADGTNDDIPRS